MGDGSGTSTGSTTRVSTGTDSGSIRAVTYNLDRAGNRTSVVDTGVSTAYTPNTLNQYINSVGADAITNGPEHEVASYQGIAYTYINDEHLNSVTSGNRVYTLGYDALGRCVKRTIRGVTNYYVYDGEKPVLEYNTSGGIVGRNVYGKAIDEILMRTDPTVNSGQPFYYQEDHEGSVTHLTNAAGTVIEKYRYDAFGAPTVYDGSGNLRPGGTIYKNRFLFTGREYAATFSFYEYRARAYHPGLGRFMSEDPKGFDAGDYNLYRYVHNDPLDLTDPMGLAEEKIPRTWEQLQKLAAARELAGLSSTNLRAALSSAEGLTMGQISQSRSAGLDPRLNRFGIPEAIKKDEQFADKFTKENPRYNGNAIVGALKQALQDGRIVPGEKKDFTSSKNVFSTYDHIIHGNLASHPRADLIPALLAHEGQHLLDPVMTKQNWLSLEARGFAVEHGFARVMQVIDTNPRTAAEIVKAYGGD